MIVGAELRGIGKRRRRDADRRADDIHRHRLRGSAAECIRRTHREAVSARNGRCGGGAADDTRRAQRESTGQRSAGVRVGVRCHTASGHQRL